MLTLKTNVMELRGVATQTSKKGNTYYVVFAEDCQNFEPYKFFCREFEAIPEGLKKGDKIRLTVNYNNFKELTVVKIERVGA